MQTEDFGQKFVRRSGQCSTEHRISLTKVQCACANYSISGKHVVNMCVRRPTKTALFPNSIPRSHTPFCNCYTLIYSPLCACNWFALTTCLQTNMWTSHVQLLGIPQDCISVVVSEVNFCHQL